METQEKKETAFDGGKDENVFDIMQGVSINIFVKKKQGVILSEARKGEIEGFLARVYHYELFGKRFEKYAFLAKTSFSDIPWKELSPQAPQYFFVPKDFSVQIEYEKGFKIDELMGEYISGVQTGRDNLYVDYSKENLSNRILKLFSSDKERLLQFMWRGWEESKQRFSPFPRVATPCSSRISA